VVIRNEAFGVWDGIGGDVHVAELTEAFGFFHWDGSSKKAEHAEAALREWIPQSMHHDMNKNFGFAQLLTQDLQSVMAGDDKSAMCHLISAAGECLHKPHHMELL
jgi:endonuclease III